MTGQRGSILAGVVGLTVGLTAALAGFLVMATNSNRLEADSESETQLHYAAESAMEMGLRWLRTYPGEPTPLHLTDDDWPTNPVVLNSANNDPAAAANNYTTMDGAQVKVVFFANHSGAGEKHAIRCFATFGSGRDTLEINYYVKWQGRTPETENGTALYELVTSQWRETVHPGH